MDETKSQNEIPESSVDEKILQNNELQLKNNWKCKDCFEIFEHFKLWALHQEIHKNEDEKYEHLTLYWITKNEPPPRPIPNLIPHLEKFSLDVQDAPNDPGNSDSSPTSKSRSKVSCSEDADAGDADLFRKYITTSQSYARTVYSCQTCHKKFYSTDGAKEHVSWHTGEKLFTCPFPACLRKFKYKKNMVTHLRSLHPKTGGQKKSPVKKDQNKDQSSIKKVQIKVQPSIKKGPYSIKKRRRKGPYPIKTGQQLPFNCAICSKKYQYPSKLKEHILSAHRKRPDQIHSIPVKIKIEPKVIMKHEITSPPNTPPRRGHMSLRPPKSLDKAPPQEEEAEEENPVETGSLQCEHCPSTFAQINNLRRHVSTVHLKEKRYGCHVCPSRFTATCSWKYHMGRVHGWSQSKIMIHFRTLSNSSKMVEPRPWRIGIKYNKAVKGKKRGQQIGSQPHYGFRAVNGGKTWACKFCPKIINRKDEAIVHMRHHTGERPFKCSTCSNSYARAQSLKRHQINCISIKIERD